MFFLGCNSLETVNIPDNVISIGPSAFSGCNNLRTIRIPHNVQIIEQYAFESCSELTSIEVDNGNEFFESDDGVLLSKVNNSVVQYPPGKIDHHYTIPSYITSVNPNAFSNCEHLESITIPDCVTSIGERAFYGCIGLKSLVLPSNLRSIQQDSFYNCTMLKSITIPSSVTSIGQHSFAYCSNLTSITIPSSVTSIGDTAFGYCSMIESIIYLGKRNPCSPFFQYSAFEGCDSLKYICVPDDYNDIQSTSFCSVKDIEPSKILFQEAYDNLTNHCYEGICLGDALGQIQRMNASEWINRTNGCYEYECDNERGGVSHSKCGDLVCINGECTSEDNIREAVWFVEIEISDSGDDPISIQGILVELRALTGIDDLAIKIEYDEEGYIVSATVYVDDKTTASIIADFVNIKSDDSDEIHRHFKSANVREVTQELSLSAGQSFHKAKKQTFMSFILHCSFSARFLLITSLLSAVIIDESDIINTYFASNV